MLTSSLYFSLFLFQSLPIRGPQPPSGPPPALPSSAPPLPASAPPLPTSAPPALPAAPPLPSSPPSSTVSSHSASVSYSDEKSDSVSTSRSSVSGHLAAIHGGVKLRKVDKPTENSALPDLSRINSDDANSLANVLQKAMQTRFAAVATEDDEEGDEDDWD